MVANPKKPAGQLREVLELHNGDQMKQPEFHFAYSNMPECYKAELIGGVVFEPSPVSYAHSRGDFIFSDLIAQYAKALKLIEVAPNATVILSEDDEVQPDILVRIPQELGGSSRLVGKYLHGAPEFVAEIAYTSRAIDLHLKKGRYAKGGVIEYVVLCIEPAKLYWFRLQENRELAPDDTGILRSIVFPGLWVHEGGLTSSDSELTDSVLSEGLKSSEFIGFKSQLEKLKSQLR